MSRFAIFVYGIVAYAVGMGGLTYFLLFMGGWSFLPVHIDSRPAGPLGPALVINVALIALFGLQHSIMARRWFKEMWTKIVPKAAERSTYVLASGILMMVICLGWQPVGGTLWHVDNRLARDILTAIQLIGWTIAVSASFMINHFELFGLQQVYYHLIGQPEPTPDFTSRYLYRFVRHPLQMGILIGMWSAPTMSVTHLMLAATMTLYILIGLHHEEDDLAATLGEPYDEYRRRVRMLIPIPK
jgi:protein-S-isoprenylcysteine O-methyltransferase Ste14